MTKDIALSIRQRLLNLARKREEDFDLLTFDDNDVEYLVSVFKNIVVMFLMDSYYSMQ